MSDTPQFGTAEYHPGSGTNACKTCDRTIGGQYFRINGAMTCPTCTEQTTGMLPNDSHGAYVRGIIFGSIGALLGLIVYSTVGIVTGLSIGYVSLLVGYVVGRAVLMGSSGVGGRRYQIAACLLTYAAISLSSVPMLLWQMAHEDSPKAAITEEAAVLPEDVVALTPGDATSEAAAPEAPAPEEPPPGVGGLLIGFAILLILGLISPFLELTEPVSGLIGLVILFVGLSIAWRMTAGGGVKVTGPYTV